MCGQLDIDFLLADMADRQYGIVARWQLLACGAPPDAIDLRVRRRRLRRVHRGVYAVGHAVLRREGAWLAAVLALGPGRAHLSHASAAALWGLIGGSGGRIEVTVGSDNGRSRPELQVHRRAALLPGETTVHRGIPVTTPARTLLDLATSRPRLVPRALAQAEVLRFFDLEALRWVTTAHRGRPGAPLLARLLDAADEPALTRSELEEAFLSVCAAAGLPRPRVNQLVEGVEVDFHWPTARLIVEVDGYVFHSTRHAFERDRERDALTAAAGWRTLHFSRTQVIRRPAEIVEAIAPWLAS